jgi:hypothetical protein
MGWVIGLDVHKDTIVAAALDGTGTVRAEAAFDNTAAGHSKLSAWARGYNDGAQSRSRAVRRSRPRRRCFPAGERDRCRPGPVSSLCREAVRKSRRGKTDQGDAAAIARVVQREDRLPQFRSGGQAEDLKLLVDYRD